MQEEAGAPRPGGSCTVRSAPRTLRGRQGRSGLHGAPALSQPRWGGLALAGVLGRLHLRRPLLILPAQSLSPAHSPTGRQANGKTNCPFRSLLLLTKYKINNFSV